MNVTLRRTVLMVVMKKTALLPNVKRKTNSCAMIRRNVSSVCSNVTAIMIALMEVTS